MCLFDPVQLPPRMAAPLYVHCVRSPLCKPLCFVCKPVCLLASSGRVLSISATTLCVVSLHQSLDRVLHHLTSRWYCNSKVCLCHCRLVIVFVVCDQRSSHRPPQARTPSLVTEFLCGSIFQAIRFRHCTASCGLSLMAAVAIKFAKYSSVGSVSTLSRTRQPCLLLRCSVACRLLAFFHVCAAKC